MQGRVSLDGAAVAAVAALGPDTSRSPTATSAASSTRRRDTDEEVLLDYQRHQRRLLAAARHDLRARFAHDELLGASSTTCSPARTDTDDDREDLETLAAALKPLSTWHALDTLQEAREACGGAGFLAENRLAALRADLDVYVTFEGDNNVLLQLVGKRLLADYAKEFRRRCRGAGPSSSRPRRPRRPSTAPGCAAWSRRSPTSGPAQERPTGFEDDRRPARSCSPTACARWSPRSPRPCARRPGKSRAEQARALFNRHQTELIEPRARARRAAAVGGVHPRPSTASRTTGTRQVLTWLRDLFGLRPHRGRPGLVPDERPHSRRSAPSTLRRTSTGCLTGCARTPRTWWTPSATHRSTSGWRWPPVRRPGARTRRPILPHPAGQRRCAGSGEVGQEASPPPLTPTTRGPSPARMRPGPPQCAVDRGLVVARCQPRTEE